MPWSGNARTAEPAPLLDIDHVLGGRQAHAAVFLRPGRREPALVAKRVVPVRDLVEERALLAHVTQMRRTVRVDPGAKVAPELLVGDLVPVVRHHDDVLEHRFALLDEGAHRLLGVLVLGHLDGQVLLEAVAVLEPHGLDGVDRALGELERRRALLRDLVRELHRRRHQLLERNAVLDDPAAIELGGRHTIAGQHHAPRQRHAASGASCGARRPSGRYRSRASRTPRSRRRG